MHSVPRKMTKTILLLSMSIAFIVLFTSCKEDIEAVSPDVSSACGGTLTDIDGNVYRTAQIGDQCWTLENLKVTKYNDGTAIPLVTDSDEWSALTTPGYCWYNNDKATNGSTYGALYNWYTVDTSKLCPTGWHVPSNAEWATLTDFLGGQAVAGGKLKESGTKHWTSPNTDATNEVDFTALPGGNRSTFGLFALIESMGYWWTTTEADARYVSLQSMSSNSNSVNGSIGDKYLGFSVRCVQD